MTYYLAGPMTGHVNFNFDAFDEAAEKLRHQGYKVINPAENFGGDQTLPYETYLSKAEEQVEGAEEGVILLEGWEGSNGARQEVNWALLKGRNIFRYEYITGHASPRNTQDETVVTSDRGTFILSAKDFRDQSDLDRLGNPLFLAILEYEKDIHKRKAAGYSGLGHADTWANFREAERWGMTSWEGCAIRLGDKYRRTQNLLRNPDNDQVGEGLFDTLIDLANYAIILICLLWEAERLQIPTHAAFKHIERPSTGG